MKPLIVTGTDTGVGKTVVSAMLALALDGYYWKPIQSGLDDRTDLETVASITGILAERLLPESYRLRNPLSPHRAAELDGIRIEPEALELPTVPPDRWLIIEGAGGVLVPLTRTMLQVELFARWRAPVVVVARTALGTINHTLLTIEALKRRAIPLLGIAFVGDEVADTQQTIAEFSGAKVLGRVAVLQRLNAESLSGAFAAGFAVEDFYSEHFHSPGAP
jgi:dethiobiotin synthetase